MYKRNNKFKMMEISTINLVYAISFLDLFAVGLTFPLFANHLRELGASHTLVGVCSSVYSGLQLFSGPLIGGWSDVRGRKSVLKITLLLCAISYGFLGLTTSILCIILLRIVFGITNHTQIICKAVISDLIPPGDQTGVYGRSAALSSLGFIVGPFLGGHLSEIKHGFTYVSGVTALAFLVNLGLATLLPSESRIRNIQNNDVSLITGIKREFAKTVKELNDIDWKVHWDSFLLRFLFCLAIMCYFSNQSLYLREKYELSQKHIGYIISFFGTISMFSAFFLDQINSFYKDDSTCFTRLFHFSLLLTSCFMAIAFSPNISVLLLLMVPFSVASTVLRVVSMELMLKKSDESHTGSLSGASNSVMSLAKFLTPFLTGVISDIFTEKSVMFVGILPSGLCVFLTLYMKKYVANTEDKNK
ncbi:major facilitator superfamily domain-containing protein 9-like [Anoplophora glabripennis]|uniref:major facilitator superfamily domain-containing protein 9-like n=1 Tax=Anoplophora glabripennis TaxID=217634 RepID=UPI000874F6B7|nr:major facilitator superfamily domain-containing protein 9-like [Anoplophora glabripennis]